MLDLIITTAFKKDAKKGKKQGKNLQLLEKIVRDIRNRRKLSTKQRDHALTGNYKNCRECHINPDWLLIYEIVDSQLILHRLGSHSELFR